MRIYLFLLEFSFLSLSLAAEYGPICNCRHFKVFTNELTWVKAKDACEGLGGRLAKIPNQDIGEMIHHYILESGIGDEVSTGFWIGLQDIATEDTFRWPDLDRIGCSMYQNWKPREPNNNTKKDQKGQDCVQMWKRHYYRWDDDYCDFRKKGYVCEFLNFDPRCERHASVSLFVEEDEFIPNY
ncbi:perlucin-like protein [Ptychodera flava]|uniref:perlucin-like protein n=1 Tax=Ptychodera flava TaxID=63121 RepID=UPI00396A6079